MGPGNGAWERPPGKCPRIQMQPAVSKRHLTSALFLDGTSCRQSNQLHVEIWPEVETRGKYLAKGAGLVVGHQQWSGLEGYSPPALAHFGRRRHWS